MRTYIIFWRSSFIISARLDHDVELATLEHLKYPHRFIMSFGLLVIFFFVVTMSDLVHDV